MFGEDTYPLIKKEKYKGFIYEIHFSTTSKEFNGSCMIGVRSKDKDIDVVETEMEMKIDNFINKTPSNWEELAEAITDTLVYHGYDTAHVEADAIKPLIKNFVKANNHKND